MLDSLSKVTDTAGVADGGEDSPATATTFEIREATGLDRVPLINAACSSAGTLRATEADANFVENTTHSNQ